MRTRLALAALAAAVALTIAAVPTGGAAPAQGERTSGDAAAKKRCKKPRALHKGRCVRRCPTGYVKKRKRGVRRCVRRKAGDDQGTPPLGNTPPPAGGGAPDPNQVQLTRDEAAGQAAVSGGDLLLEQASFGASGRTAEYTRISMYGSGESRTPSTCSAAGNLCGSTRTRT